MFITTIPPTTSVRAYNHLLGSCGVSFLAHPQMALRLRRKFPASLDGAPVLLPSDQTMARRGLDRWFDKCGVRPVIVGEFDDSALLKSFGQAGNQRKSWRVPLRPDPKSSSGQHTSDFHDP